RYHRDLLSFPTRRSSDLTNVEPGNEYIFPGISSGDARSDRYLLGRYPCEPGSPGRKTGPTYRSNRPDHPPRNVFHGLYDDARKRDRKSTRLNSSHVKISY